MSLDYASLLAKVAPHSVAQQLPPVIEEPPAPAVDDDHGIEHVPDPPLAARKSNTDETYSGAPVDSRLRPIIARKALLFVIVAMLILMLSHQGKTDTIAMARSVGISVIVTGVTIALESV